jgi:hypothetical protein
MFGRGENQIGKEVSTTHEVQFTMKSKNLAVLALLLLTLGCALPAHAFQDSSLSLQGFSGILNTPTGHVQEKGTFDALYSNQKDRFSNMAMPLWQDNYVFSVGMFSFAEIGGRLTNNMSLNQGGIRDLSGNVKFSSAPFTTRYRFSPALAVGVQDFGGGSSNFRTSYVAASADPVGWLRLSTGYGHGPDRMKGAFGGMELRAHDWVTLLGEYDTTNTNVGARLTTPALRYFPARFTATFSSPMQRSQELAISVGMIIPLEFSKAKHDAAAPKTLWGALTAKKVRQRAPEPVSPPPVVQSRPADSAGTPMAVVTPPAAVTSAAEPCCQNNVVEPAPLEALRKRLIKAGFVNVRVGMQGKTLVVEYENIRYHHNELDAVGVVAGITVQTAATSAEQLRLVVKREGLALLQIEAPLLPLCDWLEGNDLTQAPVFTVTNKLVDTKGVGFVVGDDNPGRLKPSVMVYPSLTTLVGTEYGVFDYQLSIRPELQVPLWRGATGVARWDIPVAWSHNLDKGQVYAAYHTQAQMDRLMLFQTLPLAPGLVANLGGGEILDTTFGTLNELNWTLGGGMHRFGAIQSWGRDTGSNSTRNVELGSYRFFLARQDLAFEATGGRFWGQDTGVLLNMKRFFGDVSVSLYYKHSVTPTDSKVWQQGGIQFEIPLTPRRDMAARPVQIRGSEDWVYGQETVIATSATQNANSIEPGLATVPDATQSLTQSFYDRERFNKDYILSHTERIKEGWRRFRNGL